MPQSAREHLIVFTRYPEPGHTKTRLIPALGAEGAAELQRRMTEHLLRELRQVAQLRPLHIEVRFTGGNATVMRQWLGPSYSYTSQGDGELDHRMEAAMEAGFSGGANAVLVVGTDIPGVTADALNGAFDALKRTDIVFGPAVDGGYYLIGLHKRSVDKALPHLLAGIPWGTNRVLERSQERAANLGLSVTLMQPLADIDRPEDLPVWEQLTGETVIRAERRRISVVIPALNEAGSIATTVRRAQQAENVEVIVVDGGSRDGTPRFARSAGAMILMSSPPRARQMNAGAAASSGEILLFVHADTILPEGYAKHVRRCLTIPNVVAGAFELRIDAPHSSLRIMEHVANWRSRFLKKPYGDQALFMTAATYRAVGGYPDLPIMEDYEIVRRLGRKGQIVTLPIAVITSARRWLRMGAWRTWAVNQAVIIAYYLGIAPRVLARFYRGKHIRITTRNGGE
jgi:rSAM/selenodomain-associated transferase 2/rSAM/selenodomain-associated transferase 1